jgi:hypothetical protein
VHGEFQFCQCWRVLCSLANDWIASHVHRHMEIFALIAHLVSILVRVALPGGVRAVVAESLLLKHQLLVLSRSRKRAPSLTPRDRLLFGIGAFMMSPKRLPKIAIGIKPSTLLRFHRALIQSSCSTGESRVLYEHGDPYGD